MLCVCAERFRNICARLALAQRVAAGRNEQGSERVERAMDEMGRLCFMAVIAAEQQMSQIVGCVALSAPDAEGMQCWAVDCLLVQHLPTRPLCLQGACLWEVSCKLGDAAVCQPCSTQGHCPCQPGVSVPVPVVYACHAAGHRTC